MERYDSASRKKKGSTVNLLVFFNCFGCVRRDRFLVIDSEDDSDNDNAAAVAVAAATAAVEEEDNEDEYVDDYEDEDGDDDEEDDSDDSLKKSSVLCRFFLHSTCLKGSNCEFSHDVSQAKLDNVCRLETLDSTHV